MLNDIKKTSFKYDHELKPQYIAEVRELGEYEGEPCVYIVMRENFHTRGRFRAMIPSFNHRTECIILRRCNIVNK